VNKKKNKKRNGDAASSWLFLLPTMVFMSLTALFPLLYSVYLSFFKLKINMPNQKPVFIGLANYIRMFQDKLLATSTVNTALFAIVSVALEVILGLMIAMVICSDKRWARGITSLFMIPMIMAPVAVGTLWRMMLDPSTGIINYFLHFFGIGEITWLGSPGTAMFSVIMANVWQLTPWVTVICVAGLKSMPLDCIQAAIVDGATPQQIFWKIVLPLMKPVLVIVLMIRFIDAFKVFDTIYVMTNGGPGASTEMLPDYIYKQGLKYFDAGYTAALAIVFVLIMTLCTLLFLKWRKKEEENVW
jgi:multiple sugar transport system permease protein